MDKKEQELQKRLLATFKIEAAEHIQSLSNNLIELERPISVNQKKSTIEVVYRGAHSLKGAARAVGVTDIEVVCQALENVLSALKRSIIQLTPSLLDILHDTADFLNQSLLSIYDNSDKKNTSSTISIVQRLENVSKEKQFNQQSLHQEDTHTRNLTDTESVSAKNILSDTVRIATGRLDSLLFQAEGLIAAKLSSAQVISEINDIANEFDQLKKQRDKLRSPLKNFLYKIKQGKEKINIESIRHELQKLSEMVEHETEAFKFFNNKLSDFSKLSEVNHRSLSSMVDGLLDDMKKALMLPMSSVLDIFPKLVRDLAKDQKKEASVEIKGAEIEVDRRILEEIRDPLIHLIRNSISHGIELPDIREKNNKPRAGKITISTDQQSGGTINITIADDGAGIDVTKVTEAAKKLGLINENVYPDDDALLSIIFDSGLSTSPMITNISGRGLGLAIVKEKIERLNGEVKVKTRPNIGTSFHIVLPLTLATFRGVHIQINKQRFVIPATQVEEVLKLDINAIKTIENREVIEYRNETIAIVKLNDILGLPRLQSKSNSYTYAVILGSENKIAFVVDEILDEQEILVKSLGKQLSRVRNIAGATVLGTGKAIPILDVRDLLLSAVRLVTNPLVHTKLEDSSSIRKSILIAEDSITSRALLKNILETAGYNVWTAADGVDAYSLLKEKHFDLTISDVEMPRMSGFDLTAKIREDIELKDLPVVLVTGLSSREHQERGIDVGANAYIVKSSFDQGNLLDVVRRLI